LQRHSAENRPFNCGCDAFERQKATPSFDATISFSSDKTAISSQNSYYNHQQPQQLQQIASMQPFSGNEPGMSHNLWSCEWPQLAASSIDSIAFHPLPATIGSQPSALSCIWLFFTDDFTAMFEEDTRMQPGWLRKTSGVRSSAAGCM